MKEIYIGARNRVTEKKLIEKLNKLVDDHVIVKDTGKHYSIVHITGSNKNIHKYKKSGTLRELDYFLRGIEEYNYFMGLKI